MCFTVTLIYLLNSFVFECAFPVVFIPLKKDILAPSARHPSFSDR